MTGFDRTSDELRKIKGEEDLFWIKTSIDFSILLPVKL